MDYKDRNRYSRNNYQQSPQLPRDFVINGFETLREELILNEAKDIAKSFYDAKLSSSQLRLFFNEVKALQNKINKYENEFEKNYPFILMLKSKAEYKNKDKKITVLKDFINESVDYIKEYKNVKTFENFCILFETIVGYYYGLGGERNK